MPRLILKFDDVVLSECTVGRFPISIGRLPDNDIVVDNAGVSGRHARVFRQGDQFVVEDLQSTNGTFIDDQRIGSQALKDGDQILVGKHTIQYDQSGGDAVEEAGGKPEVLNELGGTMILDTERHRELMSGLQQEPPKAPGAAPAPAAAPARPVAPPQVGVLTVLDGRADQSEYTLTSHTSMIGKADTALIRLKGWFKPKTALAIARKGGGYSATALGGKPTINGERLSGRRDLKGGDVIQVSGLTLEFTLRNEQ